MSDDWDALLEEHKDFVKEFFADAEDNEETSEEEWVSFLSNVFTPPESK